MDKFDDKLRNDDYQSEDIDEDRSGFVKSNSQMEANDLAWFSYNFYIS